jgi:protein-tyrosine phosphatase
LVTADCCPARSSHHAVDGGPDDADVIHSMKSVLFLCTGNWYRSRLSEILFNYYAMMAKLEWRAQSRGLTETSIKGISPDASAFLEKKGLHALMDEPRNPEAVKVSDLEKADLIIVLCRHEHEGMMRERFGQIPKILETQGKLRFWNVFDVPSETSGGFKGFFAAKSSRPSQPASSSCEHADMAVKLLIHELGQVLLAATRDQDPAQAEDA